MFYDTVKLSTCDSTNNIATVKLAQSNTIVVMTSIKLLKRFASFGSFFCRPSTAMVTIIHFGTG